MTSADVARGLGWFSLGLGATQLLAPRWLGQQIGVGEHSGLMRSFGVREIVTGAGVLARPDAPAGLWARVGGDALDLAMLAAAARESRQRERVGVAIAMVAGVALLDFIFARRLQESHAV